MSSPEAVASVATMFKTDPSAEEKDKNDHDSAINVTETQAPSHILQDGRFVILADPSPAEQRRFMERSIAQHGLLQQDLSNKTSENDDEDQDDNNEENDTTRTASAAPKVHPLVLASARLENDGINELNRAINLATLVQTGEYFSMSNIVADSALEALAAATTKSADASSGDAAKDGGSSGAKDTTTGVGDAGAATSSSTSEAAVYESQRIASTYVLKRKYAQFHLSSLQLQQHHDRLQAAIVAEHRPLQRLRQLRQNWRLVAPEHGTRAAPHAARPTEVLTADVDVYQQQQQHGTTSDSQQQQQQSSSSQPGRLARRVPRYATIELKSDYQVEKDLVQWKQKMEALLAKEKALSTAAAAAASPTKKHKKDVTVDRDVAMKDAPATTSTTSTPNKNVEEGTHEGKTAAKGSSKPDNEEDTTTTKQEDYSDNACWTRAEAFAIADPTLGKIDTDFDPSKMAVLNLEFAIEKPSTGFCTTACLEPFVVATDDTNDKDDSDRIHQQQDSQVLVALQHSLFCSKMFDSIRREVASDTQDVGQVRATATSQAERSTIWMSSGQNEELFWPPPGSTAAGAVSVIHVHEGEVMVQMDCEYTLRIKLVEASPSVDKNSILSHATAKDPIGNGNKLNSSSDKEKNSGGHTSAQLLVLCRALMLHAQETYHAHSLEIDRLRKLDAEEEAARPTTGLAVLRKARPEMSPRILEKCIALGSKMLMERRVRKTLKGVAQWVKQQSNSSFKLHTDWLSLSALDPDAQFTVSLVDTGWYVDVHLCGDRLTVTSFHPSRHHQQDGQGEYRKVDFYSANELELYLKRALWKEMQREKAAA